MVLRKTLTNRKPPMDFEVIPFRDSHGRWHRHILGTVPDQTNAPVICEGCHDEHSSADCIGFADWDSAIENGWQMVRNLLRTEFTSAMEPAPVAKLVVSRAG
jgi:hypothetical protein